MKIISVWALAHEKFRTVPFIILLGSEKNARDFISCTRSLNLNLDECLFTSSAVPAESFEKYAKNYLNIPWYFFIEKPVD